MKRLLFLAALALVSMLILAFTTGVHKHPTAGAQTQPTKTVSIQFFRFSPANITVEQGTKGVWVNKDSVHHTATADNGTSFDSGVLRKGERYSHTFTTTGKKAYHCAIHPFMKGSVTVKPRQ